MKRLLLLLALAAPLSAQAPCVKTGTGAFTIRAASSDTVCILKAGAVSYRVTVTAASPVPTPTPAPTPAPTPDPVPQPSSSAADIAFSDFSNGYGTAFNTPTEWAGDLTVIADPTGAGRGKVLQATYKGSGSVIDINRALYLATANTLPSHFVFTGDVYLPANTVALTDTRAQRKLVYFMCDQRVGFLVLKTWGNGLAVEWGNGSDDIQTYGLATLSGGAWHHLEIEVQLNSTPTASDGFFRIWADGKQVHERLNWRAIATLPLRYDLLGIGYQREGVSGEASVSEVRYWSRLAFSTKRLQ